MCIRSIGLYNCLLSALYVSLPAYQALLSPFRSICLLTGLSGFVGSFPLYLSPHRPIRLCYLLSTLFVFLPPYQALLSPSRSIWLNCNVLILTPLVFSFLSLQACRSASIRLLSLTLAVYRALLSPFRFI